MPKSERLNFKKMDNKLGQSISNRPNVSVHDIQQILKFCKDLEGWFNY